MRATATIVSAVALVLLLSGTTMAADAGQAVAAADIRKALVETADAIDSVLLDESGKAKGDYLWFEGKWSPYEVAWHTGQAIEGLLSAYSVTGNHRYLDRAIAAGEHWISLEIKDGPFKGMINAAHGDRLGNLINFTTVGNGTSGLFRLSRVTGDRKYADVAARAIRWLARHMKVPGHPGLYYNILDPSTGRIWTDRSPHHAVANPTVTQVARPNIEGSPFLDACKHLREQWLCEAHFDLADRTAERQSPNGMWMEFEPNDPDSGQIHPRFNTWNAEALLRSWRQRRKPSYIEAALKTARENAAMMAADGSFDYDRRGGTTSGVSPTGSATAFAGLLWLELRRAGHVEFDRHIHTAARWLIANRYAGDHPDPNVRGLVVERRVKRGEVIQRDLGNFFAARFFESYLSMFGGK
jgi:hypothetical protein